MGTNNSINLSAMGVAYYNGTGSFSAPTITQNGVVLGAASNNITSTAALTNGQLIIGSTGVAPVAANLTAGTGVTITNGAGSITISVSGGGASWTAISANQTLITNNGYIVTGGTLSLALPTTSSLGDGLFVLLRGGTSFTITQAAGQQVFFGNSNTTAGTGGSLATTGTGDVLNLRCTTANTTWEVQSSVGNFTVV